MKRTQKLYEATAIVAKLQNDLTRGLNGLGFNASVRVLLKSDVQTAYDALERIIASLDALLEDETGLTTEKKWQNAARNTGGAL